MADQEPHVIALHSPGLERALITILLTHAHRWLDDVIDLLPHPKAFSQATYGRIYGAMQALRARGEGIDPEALQETLRRNKEWDGDLDLLYRLAGGIARADDYAASTELCLTYARKLADLHDRRQDKDALLRCQSLPGDPELETADRRARIVEAFLEGADAGDGLTDADTAFGAFLDSMDEGPPPALPLGIPRLDTLLAGGLRPQELMVIAGRPSVGKSALAQSVAVQALRNGHPTLLVTTEMGAQAVTARMSAQASGFDADRARLPDADPEARAAVRATAERARDWPLWILDRDNVTAAEIRRRAIGLNNRLRSQGHRGLALVVVDYLQRVRPNPDDARNNQAAQLGAVSWALVELGKRIGCAVIALSQLNRQAEDDGPRMHHLKGSGDYEQDGDFVALLEHERDKAYKLILAKNRRGQRGYAPLAFNPQCARFTQRQGEAFA